MKKILVLFSVCLLLTSCNIVNNSDNDNNSGINDEEIIPENDNDKKITKSSIQFTNLSNGYNITGCDLDVYYNENSDIQYVSVMNFIQCLDGFIKCGDSLRYKIIENKNMLVLYKYNSNNVLLSKAQFRRDDNIIYVSDLSFFSSIIYSNSATDYSKFIKTTNYEYSGGGDLEFDLGKYNFDILYYDNNCLIPFVIANLLFCSLNYYNVIFNGDKFIGYEGEIYNESNEYKTIFENHRSITQSESIREATINSLCFLMDYFYGLNEYKNITNFKSYISYSDLELLRSLDPDENHLGMKNILLKQLDELHTRIDSRNAYSTKHSEVLYALSDCGEFWNKYYSLKMQQNNLRNEKLNNGVPPVRYYDDTAVITLNSFETASNSEIYDSDGKLKDTAWKYDSYYYMQYCMKEIESHSGINDVLLDLSLNGGGNIGAEYRVLGFLSDKIIKDYAYNTLTKKFSCASYKIDANGDGYYDDDSFDNYRWTILTSLNTFSAANNFAFKVKQMNLGKIIGKKSGGGMCSVLPTVLADGTAIAISSNNSLRYMVKENNKNIYYETESGCSVDLSIPYDCFYNDVELVDYIDEVWNA